MNFSLIEKPLRALLIACVLWYALSFLYVAGFSLPYPFSIEWLEGHVMEIVARAAAGKPIYIEPSLDYVPFIYTPFYYYVAAMFTKLLGVDFIAGRAVSILSTLGVAAVLYSWVRVLDGTKTAAFTAAGMYLAAYEAMGRWYDLARVDNLYILLLMSGLYVLHTQRGIAAALTASGLFVFAFYTKQSAPMAFAPLIAWALIAHRRDGLIALVSTMAGIIALVAWSNAQSDGWFSFYVFSVAAGHGLEDRYLLGFFSGDLIAVWWPMFAVLVALSMRCWKQEREMFFPMLALAAGCFGSSYISRIHWGSYLNVLMPMAAFFALAAGLGIMRWRPALPVVLLQFALLYYSPNYLLPNDWFLENNQKAIETISKVEGDVFTTELQFIHWPEGKRNYVYGMAAFDIFRSDNPKVVPVKEKMKDELKQAFASHRFSGVMPGVLLRLREADPYYTASTRLLPIFRYPFGRGRQQNPVLLQLPNKSNMSLIPPNPEPNP